MGAAVAMLHHRQLVKMEAKIKALRKLLKSLRAVRQIYEAKLEELGDELGEEDAAVVSGIYADVRAALTQEGEG